MAGLQARADVAQATYDAVIEAHHVREPLVPNPPNDPRWSDQYGPPLIGLGIAGMSNDGWDLEAGSSSVIVAVLDSGIEALHEDLLTPCSQYCTGANGVDVYGHGTHVAGIIAAQTNNGLGVAGVTRATLMSRKVAEFRVTWLGIVAATVVDAPMQGADVINMSLGGGCNLAGEGYVCYDLEEAVLIAHDEYGVILVASSGNNSCVGAECIHYPAVIHEFWPSELSMPQEFAPTPQMVGGNLIWSHQALV